MQVSEDALHTAHTRGGWRPKASAIGEAVHIEEKVETDLGVGGRTEMAASTAVPEEKRSHLGLTSD